MFFDTNFWEDIVKNYIASLGTGLTLLMLGYFFGPAAIKGVIKKYHEKNVGGIKDNSGTVINAEIVNISGSGTVGNPPSQPDLEEIVLNIIDKKINEDN